MQANFRTLDGFNCAATLLLTVLWRVGNQALAQRGEAGRQPRDGLADLATSQCQVLPPQGQDARHERPQPLARLQRRHLSSNSVGVRHLFAGFPSALACSQQQQHQNTPSHTQPPWRSQDPTEDNVGQRQDPCRIRMSHPAQLHSYSQ
ncbi:hypothetical protein D3C77_616920 [compost metagenome]